jgi:hypothetical protein
MCEPLIEVKDPSRLRCLVMPSPRAAPPLAHVSSHPGGSGALLSGPSLAPIEMAARSIQFPSRAPLLPTSSKAAAAAMSLSQAPQQLLPGALLHGSSKKELVAPGWTVQAAYALCGLSLGLCNLVAPGYLQGCAHLLCPVWTLAVALHVAAVLSEAGREDDCGGGRECWTCFGALTLCLLPFVILVGSPLFVVFYLFVFAAFASGAFWRRLQGAHFILVWLCWGGLLLACGLGVGIVPVQMHLSVAAFFAIALGVLNAGGQDRFVLRVV